MPELPEVETVRSSLAEVLPGRRVREVRILLERTLQHVTPMELRRALVGDAFSRVGRRGKFLLLDMVSGGRLIVHLRMTGRLVVTAASEPLHAHVRAVLGLDGGEDLRFVDQRTFGTWHWIPRRGSGETGDLGPPGLRDMGPEPLAPSFRAADLARILAGRRAPLKAVLLDQRRLAGVGSIYADEALFGAGLRPDRPAGGLEGGEVAVLHRTLRQVLRAGIRHGGTTVRSYVDGNGAAGGFQHHLQVYGRAGQPCRRCGQPLRRIRLGGRGACFCPGCQA